MARKIIHVDMDAFFASVEVRDNPRLRYKAVAVGGKPSSRGVISTCNYEARGYGVRSAMSSAEALHRCPDLILLPTRMFAYKEVSTQIRAIFARYTGLVEPLSLDEAYLDVTDCQQCRGSATLIAQQIREIIEAETGLTASAGISSNKFLAKISSDENKPDGQFVIAPDQAAAFAARLSLRKIPGVGPKTAERMAGRGLHTGQDVLEHTPEKLSRWLGKFGPVLHDRAQGIDERPVQPDRERKSVGVETTLTRDLTSQAACLDVLRGLLPELSRRLKDRPFKGTQIKLKFHDFQQTTAAQQSQVLDMRLLESILAVAYDRGHGRRVRLVGVGVTLENASFGQQLSLQLE